MEPGKKHYVSPLRFCRQLLHHVTYYEPNNLRLLPLLTTIGISSTACLQIVAICTAFQRTTSVGVAKNRGMSTGPH